MVIAFALIKKAHSTKREIWEDIAEMQLPCHVNQAQKKLLHPAIMTFLTKCRITLIDELDGFEPMQRLTR